MKGAFSKVIFTLLLATTLAFSFNAQLTGTYPSTLATSSQHSQVQAAVTSASQQSTPIASNECATATGNYTGASVSPLHVSYLVVPTISNVGDSGTHVFGYTCTFYSYIIDGVYATFSWNGTGSWTNESTAISSSQWYNVSKTLPVSNQTTSTLGYRFYANNSASDWASSSLHAFSLQYASDWQTMPFATNFSETDNNWQYTNVSATFTNSAGSHDCVRKKQTNDYFSTTDNYGYLGAVNSTSYNWGIGLRFTGVTIPQSAVIKSAVINLTAQTTQNADPSTVYISSEYVGNAADFSTQNDFDNRYLYNTSPNWGAQSTWSLPPTTANSQFTSPSITSCVQLVVNRADWVSGNSMVFFVADWWNSSAYGAYRDFISYNAGVSAKPLLIVAYTSNPIQYNDAKNMSLTLSSSRKYSGAFFQSFSSTFPFQLVEINLTMLCVASNANTEWYIEYYDNNNAWVENYFGAVSTTSWSNVSVYIKGLNGSTLSSFAFKIGAVLTGSSGTCSVEYVTLNVRSWTLINRLRYYMDGAASDLQWSTEGANYYGLLFGKTSKTDIENYIDGLDNGSYSNYLSILEWSARVYKLGIERSTAILHALGNVTQISSGGLPFVEEHLDKQTFQVYYRDVLWSCYYFGTKYGMASTWNITTGYDYFVNAMQNSDLTTALWINNDTTATTYSDRFYDENAETLGCYLVFYELGIIDALAKASTIWNRLLADFWNPTMQAFDYQQSSGMWECEGSFFLRIITLLRYYNGSLSDADKLTIDIYSRFLKTFWNSPQWRSYAVQHANGNNQLRMQNTLGAWSTMLGAYAILNSTSQENLKTMLPEVWYRLYCDNIGTTYNANVSNSLYNDTSRMFEMTSTQTTGDSVGTAMSLTLQMLAGTVPVNTSLAFPLEEIHYEYTYDVDPDLFGINVFDNTLKIPVSGSGSLKFIFGGSTEVYYSFPSVGIYNVTFNMNWTAIISATKLNGLPRVVSGPKIHDIAVDNVEIGQTVIGQSLCTNVSVIVENRGSFIEESNVALYVNETIVGTRLLTDIGNQQSVASFLWNTTGFAYGNYTLWAYAEPVLGETNTSDNLFVGGWVIIAMVGDITGPDSYPDGKVDVRDVATVARLFGVNYPDPRYNPNCDINNDLKTDVVDVATVSRHFGDHYP